MEKVKMHRCITLMPTGQLTVHPFKKGEYSDAIIHDKSIIAAFLDSHVKGLFALLVVPVNSDWSQGLLYWRNFINHYVRTLCHRASRFEADIDEIVADSEEMQQWVAQIPPIPGAEYCSPAALTTLWHDFDSWIRQTIKANHLSLGDFFKKKLPSWHHVGRVCFHLAENKHDKARPFAFIATYIGSLSSAGKLQHKPLSKALQEYAGEKDKNALSQLLQPISAAAKQCDWLNTMVENHDIYHPLAWTPEDAYHLLKDVPLLEAADLVVKFPNWWKKRAKPNVQVVIGPQSKSVFDANSVLQFDINVAIAGEPLTQNEVAELMKSDDGLVLLRGQWVEMDKNKLSEALSHWKTVSGNGGVSFIEGMRLLSGIHTDIKHGVLDESLRAWCHISANNALEETLSALRSPASLQSVHLGCAFKGELRAYQATGVAWLRLLTSLGLGACLADDMGLGKTIQVISLLLLTVQAKGTLPSLLVLPASLLANWNAEIHRFAPSLKIVIVHSSEMTRSDMSELSQDATAHLSHYHLIITTYGTLLRQPWLNDVKWQLVILDEAQAIKNPGARQTQMVKQLSAEARIALTGTPIENRLGDLWSLFDFICPGLLGGRARFNAFIKSLEKSGNASYAPLRQLVAPYILRRLKSDKRIINDLPDKTEINAWCYLTKKQATLYKQSVSELADILASTDAGIKRRGLILAYLTRFKQICNHPSLLLGDSQYLAIDSGKFLRLGEICEEIASRQEKVLVFTQYKAMAAPLHGYLSEIFNEPGLILHGGTPVKQRKVRVENFQSGTGRPFFILSLKAAGVGLNLTAASHVIHFDRWWNPAVENQATDRAYRIGQKKNVLVHKFVCKGTIEEKISEMINRKQALADDMLTLTGEQLLTEMSDQQLLDVVALDINQIDF